MSYAPLDEDEDGGTKLMRSWESASRYWIFHEETIRWGVSLAFVASGFIGLYTEIVRPIFPTPAWFYLTSIFMGVAFWALFYSLHRLARYLVPSRYLSAHMWHKRLTNAVTAISILFEAERAHAPTAAIVEKAKPVSFKVEINRKGKDKKYTRAEGETNV